MKTLDQKDIIGIAALLVHAAKIDEQYSDHEKKLIKEFIMSYLKKENIDEILVKAEELEKNSNQILNFTREVKNLDKNLKIKIIEILWKIIYSDNNPDMYENNLMRRLTGLLYLDPKVVGDIKEKVINDLK